MTTTCRQRNGKNTRLNCLSSEASAYKGSNHAPMTSLNTKTHRLALQQGSCFITKRSGEKGQQAKRDSFCHHAAATSNKLAYYCQQAHRWVRKTMVPPRCTVGFIPIWWWPLKSTRKSIIWKYANIQQLGCLPASGMFSEKERGSQIPLTRKYKCRHKSLNIKKKTVNYTGKLINTKGITNISFSFELSQQSLHTSIYYNVFHFFKGSFYCRFLFLTYYKCRKLCFICFEAHNSSS